MTRRTIGRSGAVLLSVMLLAGCLGGKTARQREYQTIAGDPGRDTEAARQADAKAADMIERGKLLDAEKELKKALLYDTLFGPAHNNLGCVYFKQGKYYLAALEFEEAARLMPGRAAPLNALGVIRMRQDKTDEAAQYFEKALSAEPGYVQAARNLAVVRPEANAPTKKGAVIWSR